MSKSRHVYCLQKEQLVITDNLKESIIGQIHVFSYKYKGRQL